MPLDFKAQVSADVTEAKLEIPSPLTVGAEDLEELIRQLAWVRASMKPEVPLSDPVRGTKKSSVSALRYFLAHQETPDKLELMLLHPGFGWLGMILNKDAFERLVQLGRLVLHQTTTQQ